MVLCYSKAWAAYNYRHNVDASLGLLDTMVNVMGPSVLQVSLGMGPPDPNVDPDYNPVNAKGEFDASALPDCLKEVTS